MEQGLRVRVLGATELVLNGRPVAGLASAKATALLVHLAVTGTAQSRSALAGLLWSDLPEETARANLRLALTKLRRVLPEQLLVTRQSVALDPTRPVWVDAVEVAQLAAAGPEGEELLAGARLCRGELLAGFEVQGAELFDEWVLARRAAARSDQLALLERAVQDARERRDTAAGVEVARRMLELEPLHEEAHRALMWFLATGGQRSAALAQFETCRYLLREELGEEPSVAAVALRDQIAQSGGFTDLGPPPSGGVWTTGAPEPGEPGGGGVEAPRPLTSLIGREEDLARLHALLDDPVCRLVTLVGPGGIGKTRLALEAGATRRGRYRDGW
jgi:DNA-binding SARP family transcriptional activator